MNFTVNERPCLLLETAELVYALINHIPAEKLSSPLPYAIPPQEIAKIQETVCGDLDPEDPELQFYFLGVPIDGREERLSCPACCLFYSSVPISCYEVDDAIAYLYRTQHVKPFKVEGITAFSINIKPAEEYTTLSQEIGKLPIPQAYQLQLTEVFSNFEYHVGRLGQLLRPLAEKLKPLLEPWVTLASPRREEWRQFLAKEDAAPILFRRSNCENHSLKSAVLTMRYVFPLAGPGEFSAAKNDMNIHMGVALPPGRDAPEADNSLKEWEYAAFRLISGPDRVAILRATKNSPKCIQDLSQELGRNPGSIFRDLNSLYNVGLLTLNIISGRNYYTANLSQMKKLTDRLLRYLDE